MGWAPTPFFTPLLDGKGFPLFSVPTYGSDYPLFQVPTVRLGLSALRCRHLARAKVSVYADFSAPLLYEVIKTLSIITWRKFSLNCTYFSIIHIWFRLFASCCALSFPAFAAPGRVFIFGFSLHKMRICTLLIFRPADRCRTELLQLCACQQSGRPLADPMRSERRLTALWH